MDTQSIHQLIKNQDLSGATSALKHLIQDTTPLVVQNLCINQDQYSLNSVNGLMSDHHANEYFFKFHTEENEKEQVSEYYQAKVLKEAGYPVQEPLFSNTTPNQQIVIYKRIQDSRFADVCSDYEKGKSSKENRSFNANELIAIEEKIDQYFSKIALKTLHQTQGIEGIHQPIFQLFYHRLVNDLSKPPTCYEEIGGRIQSFYKNQTAVFQGFNGEVLRLPFEELIDLKWSINQIDYPETLKSCLEACLVDLTPQALLPGFAFNSHGDAHHANVWLHEDQTFSLFDPAFANAQIPALLAEVKATFHNIFAHPFWLYEPDFFSQHYDVKACVEQDKICVETNYILSDIREGFLTSKAVNFWKPLYKALKEDIPFETFERTVRLALFTCPILVMNLLVTPDSSHNPTSSLIGFCQAIKAAQKPLKGSDDFVKFFEYIKSENAHHG